MVLTDDMKRVITRKVMNGNMLLYLLLSVFCIMKGVRSYTSSFSLFWLIFGCVLFVFMCGSRIKFVWDVKSDNVEVIRAVVIDKHTFQTGRRRTFLYLQTTTDKEIRQLHVLPRIYHDTNIGDTGIYVKTKLVCSYYPMKDFE